MAARLRAAAPTKSERLAATSRGGRAFRSASSTNARLEHAIDHGILRRQPLRQSLQALTADERQAIESAFFSELTCRDVAGHLKQPVGDREDAEPLGTEQASRGPSCVKERPMTSSRRAPSRGTVAVWLCPPAKCLLWRHESPCPKRTWQRCSSSSMPSWTGPSTCYGHRRTNCRRDRPADPEPAPLPEGRPPSRPPLGAR